MVITEKIFKSLIKIQKNSSSIAKRILNIVKRNTRKEKDFAEN